MPAFSFWVVGPIGKLNCLVKRTYSIETSRHVTNLCWSKHDKIGISYLHTWINVGLTLSSEFLLLGYIPNFEFEHFFSLIFQLLKRLFSGHIQLGESNYSLLAFVLLIPASLFLLCLIQLLDYCNRITKISYPSLFKFVPTVTERTLLNFDDPFEIIHLCY